MPAQSDHRVARPVASIAIAPIVSGEFAPAFPGEFRRHARLPQIARLGRDVPARQASWSFAAPAYRHGFCGLRDTSVQPMSRSTVSPPLRRATTLGAGPPAMPCLFLMTPL